MSIYCPISEALGLPQPETTIKYNDYSHENYGAIPGIRKGMLHTKDTKKLMSEKRQGHKPMLGKKHSEETKQKMKDARLKYLDTNEGQKQFDKWQKSNVWTDERKAEQRERTLLLNQNPDKIKKTAEKNRGQKRSFETRVKISEARKRYLQTLKNGV
jgi:leucyl aminopeptidase (aminopeptidase T)